MERKPAPPRVWVNKRSSDLVIVKPWYDLVDNAEDITGGAMPGVKFVVDAVIQVGWLIENGHGVFFGLNPSAADQFEDLGELDGDSGTPE